MDECDNAGFVAVHVGAGYHSPANSDLYKQVCRQACLQAVSLLRQKKSALDAVSAAVVSLEDSPWTNAGTGSNLTLQGTVECDASVMEGATLQYGAVGGMAGVKNPILVAQDLLETQMLGNMSLGRVPPSTLVAEGARNWAKKKGIQTVNKDELVTEGSRRAFVKHKRKLDMLEEATPNGKFHKHKRVAPPANVPPQVNGASDDALQDTVGAICMDHKGHIVSAVSSGGIVLKQPGRLGQAAMYGCGCWAENDLLGSLAIGVSTSGCGEHLTKTLLARECAQCLKQQPDPAVGLSTAFTEKFLNSPLIRDVEQKLGGALVVKADKKTQEGEILWAHTTDSMCLAYMSVSDPHPKALVSRLPDGKRCGKFCVVQGKNFSLKQQL